VIFTTAYDQYAIKAFKANGIAYLLKPIDQTELKQAIDRYRKFNQQAPDLAALHEMLAKLGKPPEYKQRFMVQAGSRIKSVPVTDIAYFYFLERDVFFCTTHDKHYPSEYSLERLEELTDPVNFFRINRRMLVSFTAIDSIFSLSRSRIKLELKPAFDGDVLVSFNKTPKFREWLDR
jgi:DNA-binding LytR/AlgR family response regulator